VGYAHSPALAGVPSYQDALVATIHEGTRWRPAVRTALAQGTGRVRSAVAQPVTIPGDPLRVPGMPGDVGLGLYAGPLRVELLTGPGDLYRLARLLEAFTFYDGVADLWVTAPAGFVFDGASIPRWAWAITGGPLDGAYRRAACIHDYECHIRRRPSPEVHARFGRALLVDNVRPWRRYTLATAVEWFGPRWPTPHRPPPRRVHG
jgi:hypothetical protein